MLNQIDATITKLIDKMMDMENEEMVEEYCPISIISMDSWEWPQGVALFSMFLYYKETHNKDILKYLTQWYDKQISSGLPKQNVNTTCPILTLAYLYEETKKESYLTVIKEWAEKAMKEMPRTKERGIQHIVSGVENKGQLWDDTLYMTVLFLAKAGVLFNREDYIEESIYQFLVHLKYLTDTKTGLFFHGWTFLGNHNFANALWARGNSWYTAGIVDYLDIAGSRLLNGVKDYLISALNQQVEALISLQDKDGLWHTILDDESSYLETSASSAFAYGILKGVRIGCLPEFYREAGLLAVKGVMKEIKEDGTVMGVSYGTPVFHTIEEYKEIKICPMPYGQSMALMMLAEAKKHA